MERFQGHGVCIQRKGGSPFLFIVGNKGNQGSISSLQEIYDFPRNYYLYYVLGNRLTSVP